MVLRLPADGAVVTAGRNGRPASGPAVPYDLISAIDVAIPEALLESDPNWALMFCSNVISVMAPAALPANKLCRSFRHPGIHGMLRTTWSKENAVWPLPRASCAR
jgi:hypothetical protein